MNKIKDQNDISYNQLFDNPNKSKTNNNWNKTSDIHQKLNKSNFLKQSSNQQNHSYLSTPLILIQKPQKPVIIKKEKPIPRSNIIKDPKPELKFEIKSGATTPKSSNTPKNFKNIPKSSNIPKNLKSPIKKKISMKRIPKNNSKNE